MAQAFVIPVRNDLDGVGLQLRDLRPVAGQKNSIYDGTHQDFYLKHSWDIPGVTIRTSAETYQSGSLTTAPLSGFVRVDTTGGAVDNARVTEHTDFGLAAYLRNVCTSNMMATLTSEQAVTAANSIMAAIVAGADVTPALIDDILPGAFPPNAFTFNTGASFGTIKEVLRIASGETYILPKNTVTGNPFAFRSPGDRAAIVAVSLPAYQVVGHFAAAGEPGYRAVPEFIDTEALRLSTFSGQLKALVTGTAILNTNHFVYGTAPAQPFKPIAYKYPNVRVPATGIDPVVRVYLEDGTLLHAPF